MNTDPGVMCFQHCREKVFCFQLPSICPGCGDNLDCAQFRLLPFRVPYPFVRAAQYPCSVVIKPTTGDFLHDYLNSMDLHIGLTDSKGSVVEFDKHGVQKQNGKMWDQCLVLDGLDQSWADHWDEVLDHLVNEGSWTPSRYNETDYNCYTFVLSFLQQIDFGGLSKAATSKTTFCRKYIVPRTTAAGKYISLYRKLITTNCFVHGDPRSGSPIYPESVPSR